MSVLCRSSCESPQGWSSISSDVMEGVARVFQKENYWQCLAPRLRLVNKQWKSVVDSLGLHVSMRELPDFPLCRSLKKICQENTVTSLSAHPQYGRILKLRALEQEGLLSNLITLSVQWCENGDTFLSETQLWMTRLRCLKLVRCVLTQCGIATLAEFTHVTDLQFFRVKYEQTRCLAFQPLKSMTQLRRLSIIGHEKHVCFDFLSVLTGLRFLVISETEHSSRESVIEHDVTEHVHGLEAIEHCSNLKDLDICTIQDSIGIGIVFTQMTQLTALTVSRRIADVSFYPLQNLQSLALLSVPAWKLKKRLLCCPGERLRNRSVERPLDILADLFATRRFGTDMHMTETLTSLDLTSHVMTHWTMKQLTAFRHLQQLRMHLSNEPDFFKHEAFDIFFPRITLWTMDADWMYAGQFAAKAMPSLKKLGILRTESSSKCHCFKHLTLLTGLQHINIAAGKRTEDALFWERMRNALSQLPALDRLGWKPYLPMAMPIPSYVIQSFAEIHVVVDDDNSIFLA